MAQSFLDPCVDRHLLVDEGEVIIDEVRRHWVSALPGVALVLLSLPIFAAMIPVPQAWLICLILGAIPLFWGLWKIQEQHMDRFVITNMRVFRVHGILTQHTATMPMSRILDISVTKTVTGRMFGYGHFVFESAAQAQGLRLIRFVGRPDERDLTIQRVIQKAGLRASVPGPGGVPQPAYPTGHQLPHHDDDETGAITDHHGADDYGRRALSARSADSAVVSNRVLRSAESATERSVWRAPRWSPSEVRRRRKS